MTALVAAIDGLLAALRQRKAWMAGTSPAMTPNVELSLRPFHIVMAALVAAIHALLTVCQ